jgi:hypothetical protein
MPAWSLAGEVASSYVWWPAPGPCLSPPPPDSDAPACDVRSQPPLPPLLARRGSGGTPLPGAGRRLRASSGSMPTAVSAPPTAKEPAAWLGRNAHKDGAANGPPAEAVPVWPSSSVGASRGSIGARSRAPCAADALRAAHCCVVCVPRVLSEAASFAPASSMPVLPSSPPPPSSLALALASSPE